MRIAFLFILISLCCSCRFIDHVNEHLHGKKKTPNTTQESQVKEPIISVEESFIKDQVFLLLKDSAATTKEIGTKLGMLYGRIGEMMKKNNLVMTGAPAAFYNGQQPPLEFYAAVPVNRKNIVLKKADGFSIREIRAGKVAVAHFFGPYELMPKGYDALKEWMKKNNKTNTGGPWEVYVTDPSTVKDPYLVQTDIYFPIVP